MSEYTESLQHRTIKTIQYTALSGSAQWIYGSSDMQVGSISRSICVNVHVCHDYFPLIKARGSTFGLCGSVHLSRRQEKRPVIPSKSNARRPSHRSHAHSFPLVLTSTSIHRTSVPTSTYLRAIQQSRSFSSPISRRSFRPLVCIDCSSHLSFRFRLRPHAVAMF